MRTKVLAVLTLAVCAAAGPAIAAGNSCVQYGHWRSTHMHDDKMSMDLTTSRGDRYVVEFTDACRVGGTDTSNHFVYTDLQVGNCVSAGDVWPTSRLGPCWVKSVAPVSN